MDSGSTILLLILALMLHAAIVLAKGAIANAKHKRMQELAEDGNLRAKRVLQLNAHPGRLQLTMMLSTTTLQVIIAGLALSLVIGRATAMPEWLALLLTGVITVLLTLALGDLAPEAVATLHADRFALWLVNPLRALVIVLAPVTGVLEALGTVISGLFGCAELVNRITEEEIMTLVDAGQAGGAIGEGEKEMIYSVLTLDETTASELMVPRIDIAAVEAKTPVSELGRRFYESGYSRLPVYEDSIDNIKGVIIAKDLLMASHNGNREKFKVAGDLLRPAVFVPETKVANELLKDLRAKRVHMAIVVDEYGGTAGLVTIEDLLEQIVGEIHDEFDEDEEAEAVPLGENTWRMAATIDVDDVNALLDVRLDTDESDTLGGLIYSNLGRVPLLGETVELSKHVSVVVDKVDGRRIRSVVVRRLFPDEEDAESRDDLSVDRRSGAAPQAAVES